MYVPVLSLEVFVHVLMLFTDNIREVRTVKKWQVVSIANTVRFPLFALLY